MGPTLHPDARRWVEALGLAPHPEGGYYREVFRAPPRAGGAAARAASTAIYYLLSAGEFSALHRVVGADEVWHHYDGDAVELHTIDESGAHERRLLGADVGAGQLPLHVVPAGVWQAARPLGARYALCGCTVAPGFEFADFEMPSRGELLARFPALRALVVGLTRADVGPPPG